MDAALEESRLVGTQEQGSVGFLFLEELANSSINDGWSLLVSKGTLTWGPHFFMFSPFPSPWRDATREVLCMTLSCNILLFFV